MRDLELDGGPLVLSGDSGWSTGEGNAVIVHQATLRVIDGMHRVYTAIRLGERFVPVRLFHGDVPGALVLAVQLHTACGRSVRLADRTTAVGHLVRECPQWSDRAIADSVGLTPRTVAAIRSRLNPHGRRRARVGRDGRTRPVQNPEGRRRAGELLARKPDASLREIARVAGISVGTARDVRARVERGDDPVPPRLRAGGESGASPVEAMVPAPSPDGPDPVATVAVPKPGRTGESAVPTGNTVSRVPATSTAPSVPTIRPPQRQGDVRTVLTALRHDPTLRQSLLGRRLLRLLELHGWPPDLDALATVVPAYRVDQLASVARRCARSWDRLAEELTRRDDVPGR